MSTTEYEESCEEEDHEMEQLIGEDDISGASLDTVDYMTQLKNGLLMYYIVPESVSTFPTQVMSVKYPSRAKVLIGNTLLPEEVAECPVVSWKAERDTLYTMCMIDLDSPTSSNNVLSEWLHWLVINIPGPDLAMDQAELIAQYVGVAPPLHGGVHRYVFLAYKQRNLIVLSESKKVSMYLGENYRTQFSMKTFLKDHYLVEIPTASNFFLSQWTEFVPYFCENILKFYPSADLIP